MATLEVLLREDVEHLGRRGEIVRVKAGYARNYLLPRKLATVATSSNIKAIQQERQVLQRREQRERLAAQTLADRLRGVTLEFERKASDQGIFYGSVTAHDIGLALAERGLEVERRKIHLDSPIKQPGTYTASVKLHRDVTIEILVTVRREGEPQGAETEEAVAPAKAASQIPAEAPEVEPPSESGTEAEIEEELEEALE